MAKRSTRGRSGAPRPTLKDVAAIAGVDPSLVSRVVNGDQALRIPDQTRDRVLAAIDKVGYRKNLLALGLRTGKTGLIACVVPDLTTPSYAQAIAGAQKRALESGYSLLVVTAPQGIGPVNEFRRLLDEQRVDGLLVGSGVIGDTETARLTKVGGPIVVFNRLIEGADCAVIVDDEGASRLAAKYLARLGHRQCAVLVAPNALETTQRRWRGFRTGLRENGCPSPRLVTAQGWSAAAGYEASRELLTDKRRPTAVYAASGLLHVGLLAAAAESGVEIPGELSVVALNDSELNRFTTPSTTAIQLPLEQLGSTAVSLLLQRIAGKSTPQLKIIRRPLPSVIERNSAGSIV